MKRVRVLLLLFCSLLAGAQAKPSTPPAGKTGAFKFAISGDSRNCGDIVMPAIAADARAQGAAFYWHLGDARWLKGIDEDIANAKDAPAPSLEQYRGMAWQDFIRHQLQAWGDTPVMLGIGNHELYGNKTRQEFLATFGHWANQPWVEKMRLHDGPNDREPRTYFHWIDHGIDFIYLDNASHDQFDEAQMNWFAGVLGRAAKDPDVRALIVGAHAPLPDSFGKGHAMDDWPVGVASGRRAYQLLLDFKANSGKGVTFFGSHQHFYMPNIYNTAYWNANGGVLPGYIVGSAGAHRYALPGNAPAGSKTMVYGYVLGTADASGATKFEYREVYESDVPKNVRARYAPDFIHWCFAENGDRK
ncbi:MAG: metallophosphoesterase [Candidatus Koribacter versatilis]|uniref:Metallophosphoesterase n=1 Tax=Candidatus Korobacter versatilis TaxID=658062 RepID=A0A932A990_9BACT|nr:metallophosphoesterase [Candidatus Koribacter versatilis]